MGRGFWDTLPRPFFCLAPLANVTDAAFRRLIAAYGKPHVFFTEFVSATGLCSPGREALRTDLLFGSTEHPIVAQLFTANPEHMAEAAAFVATLGFDGVDINMGCPDRAVERQGAGAALMRTPALARELVRAARAGAGGLPISVKTRLGYHRDELDHWLPDLLAAEPAAVTLHARTRQEMSKVPARWAAVARAVALARGSGTLIIGNGDVADVAEARRRAAETGCDGVMLGRAIFGTPWLFRDPPPLLTVGERLRIMVEHTELFQTLLGSRKHFAIMRKHYQAYVADFPDAKQLRAHLMAAETASEVAALVAAFAASHQRTMESYPQPG